MAKEVYLVTRDERKRTLGFYFPMGVFIYRVAGREFKRLDGKEVSEGGQFRISMKEQYLDKGILELSCVRIYLPALDNVMPN